MPNVICNKSEQWHVCDLIKCAHRIPHEPIENCTEESHCDDEDEDGKNYLMIQCIPVN